MFNSLTLPPSPIEIDMSTSGPTDLQPGDAYSIDVSVVNNSAVTQDFVIQLIAWGPNGETPGSLPTALSLEPGGSLSTTLNDRVAAGTPAGSYRLIGRIYESGAAFFDEDQVILQID